MALVKEHFPLLHCLARGRNIPDILKKADRNLILCLCECALNVLYGNVPLTENQKKTLKRYRRTLRLLADKKVSLRQKKKKLEQRGGSSILRPMCHAVVKKWNTPGK
ncbi:hypothetical protein HOLleu_43117 [Holothuria leucospilota]|uniref:Uncharacterized protein n=1 Tax=Holothuria leucospilota TaxID=206669 RepID=A0A9Q0YES4_HOLLE|nr:hypothetical protein HOLleu_43117 [Holothuria leucospilota]